MRPCGLMCGWVRVRARAHLYIAVRVGERVCVGLCIHLEIVLGSVVSRRAAVPVIVHACAHDCACVRTVFRVCACMCVWVGVRMCAHSCAYTHVCAPTHVCACGLVGVRDGWRVGRVGLQMCGLARG